MSKQNILTKFNFNDSMTILGQISNVNQLILMIKKKELKYSYFHQQWNKIEHSNSENNNATTF